MEEGRELKEDETNEMGLASRSRARFSEAARRSNSRVDEPSNVADGVSEVDSSDESASGRRRVKSSQAWLEL